MSDESTEQRSTESRDSRATPNQSPFAGMTEEQAHRLGQFVGQSLAGNYQGVGGGEITDRAGLANYMGHGSQFGGDRKMYKTLGYDETLRVDDYLQRYLRQDIAKRIVNAPADKTWQEWPEISDDEDDEEESEFEEDIRTLSEDVHALEALRNADRYAGIGYVGCLVIGFADSQNLSEEVNPGALPDDISDAIAYLTPCHEKAIKQITLNDDEQSSEFGEPESYVIDFSEMDSLEDSTVKVTNKRVEREVHASRVILIQPDRPRLEPVFNRLMDLEKVTGASAELFWRGADYGLALNMDGKALGQMGTEQRRELQEDIEKEAEAYYHGLQPFLKTAGVDVERLGGETPDPSGIADLLLQLIAGTIQMPKRILTGSERGELASTQDRASWLGHISERQQNWGEPHILRPFLDMLVEYGILAAPKEDRYDVEWPNLFELNEVEQAEVMEKKANAFSTAAGGLMAAPIATEGEVRQEIMDWGPEVGSETGEVEEIPERDPFGTPEDEEGDEEGADDGAGGFPEEDDEGGSGSPIPDNPDEEDEEVTEAFRSRYGARLPGTPVDSDDD